MTNPLELCTPLHAYDLLRQLGASPWLVRHHELVVEAAEIILDGVTTGFGVDVDHRRVLLGAALHDCGKLAHPEEVRGPGREHELAGEKLLLQLGVPAEIARICRTHAEWAAADAELEDLLVAVADNVWKGRRANDLEARLLDVLATRTARQSWEVFMLLDPVLETVAAAGEQRLARAQVPDVVDASPNVDGAKLFTRST